MEPIAPLTLVVLVVTGITSFVAFQNEEVRERLIFCPGAIWQGREYDRLFGSALIHQDGFHLLMNMISFYFFANGIEFGYGARTLGMIYFSSIVGGSLLSLFLHRNHSDYRALGASGGVCGVIFASILLFPGSSIYLFLVPIPIPSWLYAIIFVGASFYGIQRGGGGVGHDAHLGGAVVGLVVTAVAFPAMVRESLLVFGAVLGISLVALGWLIHQNRSGRYR